VQGKKEMPKASSKSHKLALLFSLPVAFAILAIVSSALEIGSCSPNACPDGYNDEGVSCDSGVCVRTCVTGTCSDTPSFTYERATDLDQFDQNNIGSVGVTYDLGTHIPDDMNKCYVFRQTTPSRFITRSSIRGYEDTKKFDSGIALFWETDSDKWYDNQHFYCSGESSQFTGSGGAVWIDSDAGNGDDFDDADSLSATNPMYCAPNANACDSLSGNCDTDCYGKPTGLRLGLYANLENGFDRNSFGDFCTDDEGEDEGDPYIDDLNFEREIVYMYVDEHDLINVQYDHQQCEYWPECNPADPCCTTNGYLRSSSYVCNAAHNAQCLSASSAGCGGIAFEDRCTGTSPECPDNNLEIRYDEACDGLTCVSQSCAEYTLQPDRTCEAGACQPQTPYDCPNNLVCLDAFSCKNSASSDDDCRPGFAYNSASQSCVPDDSSSPEESYDLEYDENGNLVSGFNLKYEYNSLNQLESIRNAENGQLIEQYVYDHNGDRKKKVTHHGDGTTTSNYYMSGNFVQTVNSSGTYNEKYHYLQGRQVGRQDSHGISFYHPDHLGSTRLVTDSSASILADLSFRPFGEPIDNSNERFLYTGKELDTTGNYYFGARYMNPAKLYTFTQPDTILPDVYDPQQINRYSYARNNPYRYTDPTGHYISPLDMLDYASLADSTYRLYTDPSFENAGWFVSDVISSAIPGLGGIGIAGKTMRYGKMADTAGRMNTIGNVMDQKSLVNWISQNKRKLGKDNTITRVIDNPPKSQSIAWDKLVKYGQPYRMGILTSGKGRHKLFFDWDGVKKHIEVYNHKKNHIGVMDPKTGVINTDMAVPDRLFPLKT
jgi:RHS repeat-associated protein